MSSSPMAKADFISSLVFFVLGIYMIVEGWGMPGAGGFIEKGGEPGKVPVLLGGIVAAFAFILLLRSVSRNGHKLLEKIDGARPERRGPLRSTITAIGCSVYAVGLLGSSFAGWEVQYHQATGLFLFIFIVGFEWESAPDLGAVRWRWLQKRLPALAGFLANAFSGFDDTRAPYAWLIFVALLQAVLVTWAVTYLFEQEFYVRLP